ncbi:MAG: hypothetical protein ACOCXJ_05810, partial [Planctomycetota bacterium]
RLDTPDSLVESEQADFILDVRRDRSVLQVQAGSAQLRSGARVARVSVGQVLSSDAEPFTARLPETALSRLRVIQCRDGQAFAPHPLLQDGDSLPAKQFSLRALSLVVDYLRLDIAAVTFDLEVLDGSGSGLEHSAELPPYALTPHAGPFAVQPWRPGPGRYRLRAVAYGREAADPLGPGVEITFTLE